MEYWNIGIRKPGDQEKESWNSGMIEKQVTD